MQRYIIDLPEPREGMIRSFLFDVFVGILAVIGMLCLMIDN